MRWYVPKDSLEAEVIRKLANNVTVIEDMKKEIILDENDVSINLKHCYGGTSLCDNLYLAPPGEAWRLTALSQALDMLEASPRPLWVFKKLRATHLEDMCAGEVPEVTRNFSRLQVAANLVNFDMWVEVIESAKEERYAGRSVKTVRFSDSDSVQSEAVQLAAAFLETPVITCFDRFWVLFGARKFDVERLAFLKWANDNGYFSLECRLSAPCVVVCKRKEGE